MSIRHRNYYVFEAVKNKRMAGSVEMEHLKFTQESTKQNFYIWILLVFLTLPQLNPGFFGQIALTNTIINCLRVISSFIILIWMLAVKRKLSIIVLAIGLQQGYLLFRTVIAGGSVRDCVLSVVAILSVAMLYDVALEKRQVFLSSQLFCFEVVIYINLVTEILFPDSMYVTQDSMMFVSPKNWFLGFYNNHTQYFLPALMIAFLYGYETGKKLRTYILTLAIFISAVLVWSGGVLVALLGAGFVYIFFKNWTRIFNYYNYWLLHIVFFIFVILLKSQNMFKWLINDILGKWLSLELRMTLWDKYVGYILENFIFGYGVEDTIERKLKADMVWACHAHNQFLEIMYQGGVINLLLFLVIIIIAGRNLYKYRNTKESKIISAAFLGWCLHGLVEPFMTPFLMGMFIVAYYSNIKNGASVPDGSVNYWKNVFQKLKEHINKSR